MKFHAGGIEIPNMFLNGLLFISLWLPLVPDYAHIGALPGSVITEARVPSIIPIEHGIVLKRNEKSAVRPKKETFRSSLG